MAVGKKGVVIGGSVILLVAIVAAVGVIVTHNGFASKSAAPSGQSGDNLQSTSRLVQAICQPTDYRDICQSALSKVANDTTEPKDLIKLSFQVIR